MRSTVENEHDSKSFPVGLISRCGWLTCVCVINRETNDWSNHLCLCWLSNFVLIRLLSRLPNNRPEFNVIIERALKQVIPLPLLTKNVQLYQLMASLTSGTRWSRNWMTNGSWSPPGTYPLEFNLGEDERSSFPSPNFHFPFKQKKLSFSRRARGFIELESETSQSKRGNDFKSLRMCSGNLLEEWYLPSLVEHLDC